MSETLRHFIWDFDGTLFNTYPVIIRNLRTALGQFGRDADPVQAMGLMLDCIPAAMKYYAETYQIPLEALNEAYQVCHRQANRELEAQPMAGVREVLTEIRDSGRYNYIFTHRKLEETRAYLAKYGMTDLFRDIMAPETPEAVAGRGAGPNEGVRHEAGGIRHGGGPGVRPGQRPERRDSHAAPDVPGGAGAAGLRLADRQLCGNGAAAPEILNKA